MRTTINIDPELVEEVAKLTGEKDHGRAVNKAMEEYIRREKIARLIALAGTIEFEYDWEEMEKREMELEEEEFRRDWGRR